jgi:hypothetical protein
VTATAECRQTSTEVDEAQLPPRATHGFATEWCIEDALDTRTDSTSRSGESAPDTTDDSVVDGRAGTSATRTGPSAHHGDDTTS